MQAVILAAGKGTRMRPLTEDLPKGLVEIDGQPILSHCYDVMLDAGATEIITVVGYEGNKIREHYGNEYRGIPMRYAEQTELRGSAHALLCARRHISGPFMLMDGDNILVSDNPEELVERQRQEEVTGGLLIEEVPQEVAKGEGVCDIESSRLVELVEKPEDPPSNFVVAGFHTFDPVILSACDIVRPSDTGEYELSDAIDLLVQAGHRITVLENDQWRENVNTPEERDEVEQRLR